MTEWAGRYFLLVLLAGALVLTFYIFKPFLTPLLLAAVFAVVLQPVYQRVLRLMPRYPSLASLATVFVAIVCTLVPLSFIGTQIGREAAGLYVSIARGEAQALAFSAAERIESTAARYVPGAEGAAERFLSDASGYAQAALRWMLEHLGGAFSGVAAFFLSFFIFFAALYYLLRDGALLKKRIVELSPLADTYDEIVFGRLEKAVNSVVRGNLSIALIQGTLTAIGFALFGVPNAILLGSITAVAALIPGVGTGLVFAPVIVFMFAAGNTFAAVGLLLWGVAAVGLVDNVLGPQFIGSGTRLHPLLVLLSVLGGIILFGATGFLVGPLALALLFALLSIYMDIARRENAPSRT